MAAIFNGSLAMSPSEKFQQQRDRRNQEVWIPAFRASCAALNTTQVPHSQWFPMPSHLTAVVRKHPSRVTPIFLPPLPFPGQATKKKEKKKAGGGGGGGLAFLYRQERNTDTCKILQQSKPCFAGLLISSILLPQE